MHAWLPGCHLNPWVTSPFRDDPGENRDDDDYEVRWEEDGVGGGGGDFLDERVHTILGWGNPQQQPQLGVGHPKCCYCLGTWDEDHWDQMPTLALRIESFPCGKIEMREKKGMGSYPELEVTWTCPWRTWKSRYSDDGGWMRVELWQTKGMMGSGLWMSWDDWVKRKMGKRNPKFFGGILYQFFAT